MDYLKIIREFPNLKEYLKVLITTGSISNEATIGEIFAKLEQELKKARKESSITVEIEKKCGMIQKHILQELEQKKLWMHKMKYQIY